jgi:hypothetical protein
LRGDFICIELGTVIEKQRVLTAVAASAATIASKA